VQVVRNAPSVLLVTASFLTAFSVVSALDDEGSKCPFTHTGGSSTRARVAVCSTERFSEVLIRSPRNMAAILLSSWHALAKFISSVIVPLVT